METYQRKPRAVNPLTDGQHQALRDLLRVCTTTAPVAAAIGGPFLEDLDRLTLQAGRLLDWDHRISSGAA